MKETLISEESQKLIEDIEIFNQNFSDLSSSELIQRSEILSEYRKKSSSTLQKQEIESWIQANQFISEKINAGKAPTWADLCYINKLFDPESGGRLRTTQVFVGNYQTCSPDDLPQLINIYIKEVLVESQTLHPLLWASRARYWLVTIHPFIDGNGRTSNLVCDWILALNGYLPLSFHLKVDSHIGGWEGRSHFSDFDYACIKTLSAVKNTYELMALAP